MCEIPSTNAMKFVVLRDQEGVLQAKHFHTPSILLGPRCGTRVHLIDVLRIINVYFIGADADDGPYVYSEMRKA